MMIRTRRSARACRPRALVPLIGLIAAALTLLACGDGGRSAPATPTPEPVPTADAERSPTAAAAPSPPSGDAPPSIDLAITPALLTIYGADSGDFLSDIPGMAAGDFNDDGLDDIVVGARFGDGPDNSRRDAGEAYVIFGRRPLPGSVDLAAGEQDMTIYGESAEGNFGFSAAAGDVNGDGIDDILVGAPTAARSGGKSGAVYVIFGANDLAGTVDTAAGQQDLTIYGPGALSFFGDSLAIGDVNGDGANDIIIGSTFASDRERGASNLGGVYAVFGPVGAVDTIDTAMGEQDVVIFGAEPLDELGDFVASGDVNGDGIDDIIATAEAADGPENDRPVAAEVHVVFGSRGLSGTLRISEGDQDVSIYGAEAHDTLGSSLASGDLDGDTIDDIIIGARLADGPSNDRQQAGEAYVVFGAADLPGSIDIAQGQQDLTIFGAAPSDFLGSSAAVGDYDGDGNAEAVVGSAFASGAAGGRADSGAAYVLAPISEGGSLDIAAGAWRLAVFGAAAGDSLGSAIASGDLNGDGREEIIIMAAGAAGLSGTPQAGRIYVVSP